MTLDATPAGDEADSYLEVADADALAGADLGPEAEGWLASDLALKEAALRRATREVDAYVATGWPPYDEDQALLFPREQDVDASDDPMVPRRIVLATYQQATYVLKNADVLAAANVHRARTDGSDASAAYGVDPNDGPAIMAPMALHYLSGFRTAPRAGGSRGIGSVRVSSGFVGTPW